MVILWTALLHILLASAAVAADFSGQVVSVLDGDTLEVLHHRHPDRTHAPQRDRLPGHTSDLTRAARNVLGSMRRR